MVEIAAGVENGHAVGTVFVGGHDVEHGCKKAVRRADVGEHLEVEVAAQHETPIALTGGTSATRQALPGVAVFEVVRIEMHGLARGDGERDRPERRTGIVDRLDADLPRPRSVVDYAHESLTNVVPRRGKQRHRMIRRCRDCRHAECHCDGESGKATGGLCRCTHGVPR